MFLDPMLTSVASIVSYPSSTSKTAPTRRPRSFFPGFPNATMRASPRAHGFVVASPASFSAQSLCDVYRLNRGPVMLTSSSDVLTSGADGGVDDSDVATCRSAVGRWRKRHSRLPGVRIGAELDRWRPMAGSDFLRHMAFSPALPAVTPPAPAVTSGLTPAVTPPAPSLIPALPGDVNPLPPAVNCRPPAVERSSSGGPLSLKLLLLLPRSAREFFLDGARLEALLEASLLRSLSPSRAAACKCSHNRACWSSSPTRSVEEEDLRRGTAE